MNTKGGNEMTKADELLLRVGAMFERNQRQQVNPDEVKRKFDEYVRDLAEGRTPIDLTVEEVFALGDWDGCCEDMLPTDVAEALGLEPQTTYGEVIFEAHMEVRGRKAA
jgi:hypothetical protein